MSEEKKAISDDELEDRLLQAVDHLRQLERNLREKLTTLTDENISEERKLILLNNHLNNRASSDEKGAQMQAHIDKAKRQTLSVRITMGIKVLEKETKRLNLWIDKLKETQRKIGEPDFPAVRDNIDDVYDGMAILHRFDTINGLNPLIDEMQARSKSITVLEKCLNDEKYGSFRRVFDTSTKIEDHGFSSGLNSLINALHSSISDTLDSQLDEEHPSYQDFIRENGVLMQQYSTLQQDTLRLLVEMQSIPGLPPVRNDSSLSVPEQGDKLVDVEDKAIKIMLGFRTLLVKVQEAVNENQDQNMHDETHGDGTNTDQQPLPRQQTSPLASLSALSSRTREQDSQPDSAQAPSPSDDMDTDREDSESQFNAQASLH